MSEMRLAVAVFAGALLLRVGLLWGMPGHLLSALEQRKELSTPLTEYRRLEEGVFLFQHGISPYDGGVNYHPPLLLAVFGMLDLLPTWLHMLVFPMIDVACGYFLWRIAKSRQSTDVSRASGNKSPMSHPLVVAALYLANPYVILGCLVRSTLSINHLAVLASVAFTFQGNLLLGVACLSIASYLSIYPVMVLPAIGILAHSVRPSTTLKRTLFSTVAVFIVWSALLLGASRALTGSWEFLRSTFGVILTVPDLTPNVGLFWYYFMEMFDHFRGFFLGVFQMNAFIYTLPVTYRFRRNPLFAIFVLCGITSIFKSYPSFGDAALHLAFLPMFSEIFPNLRYSYVVTHVYAFTAALAVVFYHVWIVLGTGNANFFFAITLVHALGQIILIVDTCYAMLRHEFILEHPQYRNSKLVHL